MKAYINHINNYPVDSTACFVNTHSLESDLTGGHSLGKNCVPDGKCIVRDQVSGLIAYNDMLRVTALCSLVRQFNSQCLFLPRGGTQIGASELL